ncbi:hypothetical protein D3C85_1792680 [compost metagenome]
MPLRLHVAAHHAERSQRLTVLAEKPGNDGVEGLFPGCQAIGVSGIKTELLTAVLQGDADDRQHHYRTEIVIIALDE